ncbi:hypothetical protein [Apilactobacillus xinyiensis]|uniref:hypothetical protein n=1 Tax=Apilactobacillus xinyiensis TaxID=2841032 RepID=UPI00200CF280|nr:hypothetical protein [Apilactobacillus xinyiensis]MCL0330530.1 hypothetical protein [Apilactobacillus xinyiensis]
MPTQTFNGQDQIDMGDGNELDLYRAKDVAIDLIRGSGQQVTMRSFQDGDMISGSKTNNLIDPMSDAQGSSSAAIVGDRMGQLQSTVQQGSNTNRILSDIYNATEVFALWVTHGHEKYGGNHCMIQKAPDSPYGKSVPTRQWTITVFDYLYDGNVQ